MKIKRAAVAFFITLLVTGSTHAQTGPVPKCKTPTVESDAACFLIVSNHDNCYIAMKPGTNHTFTWSGKCRDGLVDGRGQEISQWFSGTLSAIGTYIRVFRNGPWELRWGDGTVWKGSYVKSKKHGRWEERYAEGVVAIGRYVNGKKHGEWYARYPNGQIQIGPYVDGKQHGQWEIRRKNGHVDICSYSYGKKLGKCQRQ